MKLFTLLPVLFFYASSSSAQLKEGATVINTGIASMGFSYGKTHAETGFPQKSETNNFFVNAEATAGKFRNRRILSFGLSAGYQRGNDMVNKSHNFSFNVAPVVSLQRFYRIADRIYYSPVTRFSVGYTRGKASDISGVYARSNGVNSSLAFSPLSVTFVKSDNMLLYFKMAEFNLGYAHTKTTYSNSLIGPNLYSTSFSAGAGFTNIGVGIIKRI